MEHYFNRDFTKQNIPHFIKGLLVNIVSAFNTQLDSVSQCHNLGLNYIPTSVMYQLTNIVVAHYKHPITNAMVHKSRYNFSPFQLAYIFRNFSK